MEIRVDPLTQTITLRGINFPADCIRAAMLETNGVVVSDPDLNMLLDTALKTTLAAGKKAEMLIIEAIPATIFYTQKGKITYPLRKGWQGYRSISVFRGKKAVSCLRESY